MATYTKRLRPTGSSFEISSIFRRLLPSAYRKRGSMFGLMILIALVAFEIFNYSTTEFALGDLIGDLKFSGIRWATMLALAFCAMDFAGIARLFTPERLKKGAMESWYLLGAWLLAATMNAVLTWWAISTALLDQNGLGNEIVGRETLLGSVPVFVAILVWLIRVLMIGSFTLADPKLIAADSEDIQSPRARPVRYNRTNGSTNKQQYPSNNQHFAPAPKPSRRNS